MQKENLVELSGTVETVVYKNEESGFAVLELDHDGELVTVVGELTSVGEGEMLTLHGSFRTHPNYGTQFNAVAAQQRLPASASAILRYLSSGAIKGIGPVLASRMVAQFGNDTLQVLEHRAEPDVWDAGGHAVLVSVWGQLLHLGRHLETLGDLVAEDDRGKSLFAVLRRDWDGF